MWHAMKLFAMGILIAVSAFYAYGGLIHVGNMLSLTGFDWLEAPLKWPLLDVAYLGLDVLVALGLWHRRPVSIVCFYVASLTQIVLYTVGRTWVFDVTYGFLPAAETLAYVDSLVLFHVGALVAVTMAIILLGQTRCPS